MFPAEGAADLQKQWSRLFEEPDFALSWQTEHVLVTKSGTIAYTSGSLRSGDGKGPYMPFGRNRKMVSGKS
jgi:ketosteroid isomerase-like protein